ncbi:amidophosphoribosyltransferase [Leifsonia xyli subsp. xyli]|uniref:Amidophosphoribosyltransferase n=2 Tax=Leifsonia xyli subsp. xyli TaxID=59736 RepID=Q6ACE9_LEIXX|nr:amidophosphoribosyltransferase [Leifsonia xyli]AAT89944.1 amidophosphoribosyltransferase [Leifsonia xyli subsp. xyli str. CTCB07]ODA90076.1 amidophosphoribosyltransferase [Leifsonia xyli subsp. xyli]
MAGGDGRLSHDLLPGEKGPQDACGVFGVWAPGEEVAKLSYFGLYALQHRGQESAGIATSDDEKILIYKDMGLVSQVFNENALNSLTGHIAVGHTRYSTTGASSWQNAQPTLGSTSGGTVALGHNGNLTNTAELMELVQERYPAHDGELSRGNTTDTAVVTALLTGDLDHTLEETALEVLPRLRGAFCLVFMDEHTLYAARDPQGVRPLVLGRLERGWVVASETAALDIVGASFVREVEPGEFIAIDENGLRSSRFAAEKRAGCVFEYVYLARPDTTIAGRGVYEARVEMGRQLAREHEVAADLVIPTPESGTPAAIGYAQAAGVPFGQGLVKNSYVGRTFIQPSQTIRQRGIKLKLNPLKDVIKGKRLVVVDDSIVRGNTQRALVSMLREAGAAEVHVRISSPPITWPCFYGIDFASRAELIATGLGVEEVRQSIGADSLGYLSEDGMIASTEQPRECLCTACFTGVYPIALPAAQHLGKNLLERPAAEGAAATGDGCEPGPDSEHERLLAFGDPGRQE